MWYLSQLKCCLSNVALSEPFDGTNTARAVHEKVKFDAIKAQFAEVDLGNVSLWLFSFPIVNPQFLFESLGHPKSNPTPLTLSSRGRCSS